MRFCNPLLQCKHELENLLWCFYQLMAEKSGVNSWMKLVINVTSKRQIFYADCVINRSIGVQIRRHLWAVSEYEKRKVQFTNSSCQGDDSNQTSAMIFGTSDNGLSEMAGTGILVPKIGGKNVLTEMAGTGYCRYGNSGYSRIQGWTMLVVESDGTMWQTGSGGYCCHARFCRHCCDELVRNKLRCPLCRTPIYHSTVWLVFEYNTFMQWLYYFVVELSNTWTFHPS
jgi:hypothetical protein